MPGHADLTALPLDGDLVAREIPGSRMTVGTAVRLSRATRPLDFLEPWVVDPRVERFGMIYDISDFSQTLSVLHRAGTESQDDAFRKMFRFQRRINRLRSRARARCEHVFHVVKRLWGFRKVRYRGLAKNTARLFTAFALANLYLLRRRLLPPPRTCLS